MSIDLSITRGANKPLVKQQGPPCGKPCEIKNYFLIFYASMSSVFEAINLSNSS